MDSSVELLRKRVVDDPYERSELVGKGQRDGHVGEGVDKVCRAVDGIDYKGWGGRQTGGSRGRFFAQEANNEVSCSGRS